MYQRILISTAIVFVLFSACSNSKNISASEEQELAPIGPIKNYTPRALIEEANCHPALTNTTFLKILDKLESETIVSSRVEMAEKVLEVHCYTSYQITKMMALFSFEKNILSIAKSAYSSCYDQDNYFIVSRELKLEQSKTELQTYIDGLE